MRQDHSLRTDARDPYPVAGGAVLPGPRSVLMRLVATLITATLLATSAYADPPSTDHVKQSKHHKVSAARGSAVSEPRQPVPSSLPIKSGPPHVDCVTPALASCM